MQHALAKRLPQPSPAQVVKGSWQLDGKHHGDAVTDRTSGGAAIEDMERFVRAGGLACRACRVFWIAV